MKTIKSKRDFERLFSSGKRLNGSLLRVRVACTDEGVPGRVAFVAAKRLANAVFRNRCKRVLREAARLCSLPRDGFDVLLFSTRETHDSSPEQLVPQLRKMLERAGV